MLPPTKMPRRGRLNCWVTVPPVVQVWPLLSENDAVIAFPDRWKRSLMLVEVFAADAIVWVTPADSLTNMRRCVPL